MCAAQTLAEAAQIAATELAVGSAGAGLNGFFRAGACAGLRMMLVHCRPRPRRRCVGCAGWLPAGCLLAQFVCMDTTIDMTRVACGPTGFLWRPSPPRAEFLDAASTYDVPPSTAAAAWRNLASGDAAGAAFSGKLASGKDTVAPLLLARLDVTDPAVVGFSHPLKREVTELVGVVDAAVDAPHAAEQVAERFAVGLAAAETVTDMLWADVHGAAECSAGLSGWSRTAAVRAVLQFWGTEVRRAADPLFWVRRAARQVYDMLAAGRHVQVTDLRFLNEAVAADAAGLVTVRVDVTCETQRARLRARDGLDVTSAAASHPSETELDGFDGFRVRVSNDGPLDDTVDAAYRQLTGNRTI